MNKLVGIIERDGVRKGSGFLISKDIIVTAKHVVISPAETLGEINEVEVGFRYNDELINGKTINLKYAFEKNIDIVFIELDEILLEDELNTLSIPNNELTDFECQIIGYPQISNQEIELHGVICNCQNNYVIKIISNHGLQSFDGFSGSPVFVQGRVIGVAVTQSYDTISAVSNKEIHEILGFGETKYTTETFKKRYLDIGIDTYKISEKSLSIISSVGPRYSNNFSVNTACFSKLWSFLDKNSTRSFVDMISAYLQDAIRFLNSSFSCVDRNEGLLLAENYTYLKSVNSFVQESIESINRDEKTASLLLNQLTDHCINMQDIIRKEIQRFEQKYGVYSFNNKSWRGYMASYMCAFPTQYLDELIEAKNSIKTTVDLISAGEDSSVCNNMVLVTGKGGIGKTHLLCDISSKLIDKNAPAIILLGDMFNGSDNPLSVISLNYSGQENYSKFLSEINAEGNGKDFKIPICLDAINETKDNEYWNTWLPLVIEEIKKYDNLVLIISCRTIYLKEYLNDSLIKSVSLINHTGFEQNSVEAINKFCEYYQVSINYASATIPEFINPLMLKMLCEIASEQEDRTVGVDDLGILMDKFIDIKNQKITRKYPDYLSIKDRIVNKAMRTIANAMSTNLSLSISWSELRILISAVLKEYGIDDKTSGFIKELVSENLLREYDYEENEYSFGYQKFYEYTFAAQLVNYPFDKVLDLLEKQKISLGTLEMLQILYFRKNGEELINQIPNELFDISLSTFVSGLYWRKKEDYGKDTYNIVENVFKSTNVNNIELLADGLLEIATKTDSCLNAMYIHDLLTRLDSLSRDYFLSFFFLKKYESRYIVRDLCERAINLTTDSLSDEVIVLWKIILCWGTSLNYIKLRDAASKALCSLFCASNKDTKLILHHFENVDDDYIQERLYQAIYSAIVIREDKELASEFIEYLTQRFSTKDLLPQNVLIRYYIRNVFEYSYSLGWCDNDLVIRFRPPYSSVSHIADEEYINAKKELDENLFWNCTASDFAIYTIPRDVEDYGFTQECVGKLVFEDIVKLGYINSSASKHDQYIDYTYGSLRSRDEEVERIGKKYQKIYLYREMGNVFDNGHYAPRFSFQDNTPPTYEQGIQFRKIDLMRLPGKNSFAGNKLIYPFYRYAKWDDIKWFTYDDIDKYLDNLFFVSNGNKLLVLKAYLSDSEKNNDSFREVWMHFNTYIYDKENEAELVNWLKGKDFEGRWMPEGFSQMYENCVGEYLWSPYVQNYIKEAVKEGHYSARGEELPCKLITTVNDWSNENDSLFFKDHNSSIMYPSEFWYSKLDIHWDGRYSFIIEDKEIFKNAANDMFYIDFKFLKEFLAENHLGLILTVLGEKQHIGSVVSWNYIGRSDFSISYILKDNDLCRVDKIYNVQLPKEKSKGVSKN